jgi:hypothetical protein
MDIEIVTPVVDTKGKFNPEYEIKINPDAVISSRYKVGINEQEGSTEFNFDPPIVGPRLAEVLGQEMGVNRDGRVSKDKYWTEYIPKGQNIHNTILASNVLAKVTPQIIDLSKYSPKVYTTCLPYEQPVSGDFQVKWKINSSGRGIIIVNPSSEDNKIMIKDDEYNQDYELKPDSVFTMINAYGVITLKKGNYDHSIIHLIMEETGEFTKELLMSNREDSTNLKSNIRYISDDINELGVENYFRIVYPTITTMSTGLEYVNNLEEFLRSKDKEILNIEEEMNKARKLESQTKKIEPFCKESQQVISGSNSALEKILRRAYDKILEIKSSLDYPVMPKVLSSLNYTN